MNPGTGDPVWCSGLSSSRIAVIAALELEADILRRVPRFSESPIHVSGPGPERAGAAALRAVEAGAEALVVWGVAGGLTQNADCGTVMLPARILADGGAWSSDASWCERIASALGSGLAPVDLPLFSMDHVLSDPEQKGALAGSSGAAAVDMESAAVARVAAEAGLPFVVLRVVADGPDDALPDKVESLITDDGRMRLRGLANFILAPRQLVALVRLGRRSQRARQVLERVAVQLAEVAA